MSSSAAGASSLPTGSDSSSEDEEDRLAAAIRLSLTVVSPSPSGVPGEARAAAERPAGKNEPDAEPTSSASSSHEAAAGGQRGQPAPKSAAARGAAAQASRSTGLGGSGVASAVRDPVGWRYYAVWRGPHGAHFAGVWAGPHPEAWKWLEEHACGGAFLDSGLRLQRFYTLDAAINGYNAEARRHRVPQPGPLHRWPFQMPQMP